MRATCAVIVLATACGRLGFDEHDPTSGGGPGDPDPNSTTPDSGVAAPQLPSAGLVAYWNFDDLGSTGAMSTSGDMAVCTGAECPAAVAGVSGMAANFNGTSSCLHVPSMSNWTSSTVTLSAWVNIPGSMVEGVLPVITRDLDGCPSPGIQAEQGDIGFLFMGQDTTHYHAWTTGGGALTGGTWHQLGVRWDGTMESVFVDGACACNAAPGQQILFDGTTGELQIGCDAYTPSYTEGTIDEVRVYDRALTDDEMATLVAVGGRTAPTPQACTATCEVTTAGP